MPQITVLMTTYNEDKSVFENSLKSVLEHTYKDFKILIVVDNSKNIQIIKTIEYYSKIDSRISWVVNENNLGLAMSLNKGIDMIDTEYIARMDADDIADKERLEKQICYMQKHQDVDLIGTNVIYMDNNSNILYPRAKIPTDYKSIKKVIKYVNVFHHPTFFGKTSVFKTHKYRNLQYSQDYDLICRLLENNCKLENIPEYLLKYRLTAKINEDKLIKQRITYYCIQKSYRQGILSKVDIETEVANELEGTDKNKVAKSILYYDEAFIMKKANKRLKFIKLLFKSFATSKYQRRQIINLLHYYFINK